MNAKPHMHMIPLFLAALVLAAATGSATADNDPVGTAFSYQGRLTEAGEAVSGTADLVFRLYDVASGGTPLGELFADDFELGDDGLFTIDLDFGDEFTGAPRWLDITVNGEVLSPRQPIMAAPHAMVATTAANVPAKALIGTYSGVTGVGTLDSLNVAGNAIVDSRIGIGTAAPVSALEAFSYTGGWDGMWMRTTGIESKSFYGYQAGNTLAQHVLDAEDSNWRLRLGTTAGGMTDRLVINTSNGNVGIGTNSPEWPLHVVGRLLVETSGLPIRGVRASTAGTFPGVHGESNSTAGNASGVRGQIVNESPSASSAGVWGHNFGTAGNGYGVRGTHNAGGVGVHGESSQSAGVGVRGTGGTFGVHGIATNSSAWGGSFAGDGFLGAGQALLVWGDTQMNGSVGIGTGDPQDKLHVNGTTRTNVLRIMGGSDLSERFDVADIDDLTPSPGMVVCIDPANPGRLIPSTRAYDRTVAGVISGANGINSGMIMGQEGSEADGAHPVALTGRVYVMVDADLGGAIVPGDLLTTSDLPGHAMKVTDFSRAHGAIIGKAMTHLAEGERGLVLVLVSLQ